MKPTIKYLYKKKSAALGIMISGALLNLSFQNCAPAITKFTQTSEEILQKVDILSVSGTEEVQNMCKNVIQQNELIDCSAEITLVDGSKQSRESWELAKVKAQAAADPSLVPFKISYSFGTAVDEVAQVAHQRAALTNDRTFFVDSSGFEYMPVGVGSTATSVQKYYKVDFNAAKSRFASGQSCFYDVAQLPSASMGNSYYFDWAMALPNATKSMPLAGGAKLQHVATFMVYDYCAGSTCATNTSSRYGAGKYGRTTYPGRLLSSAAPHNAQIFNNATGISTGVYEKQIFNAYFADFRDAQFKLSTPNNPIVKIGENYIRGQTSEHAVSDILDLKTILANFNVAAANLAADYTDSTSGLKFGGLNGSKQLLANLCAQSSMKGTSLSVQYTPIVVDRGLRGIITTSITDGVMFDMKGDGVKRPTAWLGGRIKLADTVSSAGVPMKKWVSQEIEDGFLVIPDADGQVTSSQQLFGSNMEVNSRKYINGFEALIALTNKDCRSQDIKKQYFGPWDGDKYNTLVKVWVDKNGNGISDTDEIMSLHDAGVSAISACYTNKYGMTDSSGNETAIRSIMIFDSSKSATEDDLLNFIANKRVISSSGLDLEKRIAIDIIFKGEQ